MDTQGEKVPEVENREDTSQISLLCWSASHAWNREK